VIRTRRAAWGDDPVNSGIRQLPVEDVTQQNIQDATFLSDLMQQTTGANDSLQGSMPSRTTRISASEIQGVRQSGLSRLEKAALIISMQGMQPIGRQFAHNAQQKMSERQWVKVTGDLAKRLESNYGRNLQDGRTSVDPYEIVVDYDLLVNDGSIPGKQNAQIWTELYQVLAQNPQVAKNFDMVRIFKHIAQEMGARNVDNFELDEQQAPQVQPDEDVMEEVRKGNLVPQQQNGAS
jgi:hypothetical protein